MKRALTLLVILMTLTGCATHVRRTKENDAMLRVLLDPTIPAEQYIQIQTALVQSEKFEVIDRRDGFAAAIREQDLQHRSSYSDRFSDKEKWAHIGRMYGARGIITAHATCYQKKNFWGTLMRECKQTLTFIDGYTGRVEFAVTGKNAEEWVVEYSAPDWDDVVAKVVSNYPEYFKPRKTDKLLEQYMAQSEELAKRERAAREVAAQPTQRDMTDDIAKYRVHRSEEMTHDGEQDLHRMSTNLMKKQNADEDKDENQ